ncbi:Seipin [Lachancea thermotolerans]|uniref:KLTH0D14740p n=1 Tax=Lachancea thermotolerans (strain ATCC 56472 / CBS 6340 / NRRL Y-8284) TaxID=559295 RepID=C5DFF8_LACTC|nr:KLTH0D14740p [Lachancea thermotolerans CBS 6340]CAR22913.1 KLTH0D14740p [Lachancea thermotolerans CBS 6340]
MQINLTLPLKWAQWWAYILVLMLVNIAFIFPLSAFLFRDFYSRMIPPDTTRTVSFSESKREMGGWTGKTTFQFDLKRYSTEDAKLPFVSPNGFAQSVPLRSDIPYNMDVNLNIFCLNKVTDWNIRDAEVSISVLKSGKSNAAVVFRKTLLLSCANTRDVHSVSGTRRLTTTFAKQIQDELVNSYSLENPFFVEHDVKCLEVSLRCAGNANLIIDPNSSELKLSMNFENSLRNLMIRWKKLTYAVGTVVFDVIITSFFFLAFGLTFLRAGRVKERKDR